VAACRQQWAEREHGWLVAHGLPVAELFGANVYAISSTKYLWERRCLQGTFHGQQLIVCDITDSAAISVLELDRCRGWRCHRAPVGTQSIHDILELFSGNRVASAQHFSLEGAPFSSRFTC
jgi:hypothetical protein